MLKYLSETPQAVYNVDLKIENCAIRLNNREFKL